LELARLFLLVGEIVCVSGGGRIEICRSIKRLNGGPLGNTHKKYDVELQECLPEWRDDPHTFSPVTLKPRIISIPLRDDLVLEALRNKSHILVIIKIIQKPACVHGASSFS